MSAASDGGQAFPGVRADRQHAPGMSLRDWFAGLAMQSLIAGNVRPRDSHEKLARDVYHMADAMLAERSKP